MKENITKLPYGDVIENASRLANGVQASFFGNRAYFKVSNQKMEFDYGLKEKGRCTVASIRNTLGNQYIENSADVFIRMEDGMTYYASNSAVKPKPNITRMGYYYYEVRVDDQNFEGNLKIKNEKVLPLDEYSVANDLSEPRLTDEGLVFRIANAIDPHISYENINLPADRYTHAFVTMKIDSKNTCDDVSSCEVFVMSGGNPYAQNRASGVMVKVDGEFHTYAIPLSIVSGYNGELEGARIDFCYPIVKDDTVTIKEFKIVELDGQVPASVTLSRGFLVYSDKMHHFAQFATSNVVNNVKEVGMITKIEASSVSKILVKDASGIHDSLQDVDWSTVESVGFDVTDAGIFGYIMPNAPLAGKIKVDLVDGVYEIEQTREPEGNSLIPSLPNTNNANDFYIGQRIYNDENHDFTEFLYETYCERNPLPIANITLDAEHSCNAEVLGYNAKLGMYTINMLSLSSGWSKQYLDIQNEHLNAKFAIKGDDTDRRIYVMNQHLRSIFESAALLSGEDMLLPIPVELTKNFCEGGPNVYERNIFEIDDLVFTEAIVPVVVNSNETKSYNMIVMYQNWGNYPLKQLSSIRYGSPYYHLATGVSETNCITPWYNSKVVGRSYYTLPDFRGMSEPIWIREPEHTSAGSHEWLVYVDSDGKHNYAENTRNVIDSYGPTYADISMEHISTDGKMAVTYTHVEMPQTDENRTYYKVEYNVLEDISINDFKKDFKFYSVTDNVSPGLYQEIGYLNENNECATAKADIEGKKVTSYLLGNEYPYFSYYNMGGPYNPDTNPHGYTDRWGYANVACLISSSEFIMGGKKVTPQFIVTEKRNTLHLSLNLDKVELKAGDKFTLNMILMPWGSELLDGRYDIHKDKNVRDVRKNSLFNPQRAVALANCKVIEDPYIPKLRTTNKKSAEFAIMGGNNNVSVRVYGFSMLTVPKLYEKVGKEWLPVELNSANNPDKKGFSHNYDGYNVFYDEDGSYSYAFVTKIENGRKRVFKLVANEKFEKWPE